MVRWCAYVSWGLGRGKVGWQSAGVRIGGRELGALGVWSRIFVLGGIGAYLRVVYERGC